MRNRRLIRLVFLTAITSAAVLASLLPAQAEDSIIKLVSVANGKCLQPINTSTDRGEAIVQEPCNGSVAQQWTVQYSSNGQYAHLINRSSQLCLDARGKGVDGTPIQQWPCNWISNEKWSFGITNNLLASEVSDSPYTHCVASPGTQDRLPMELRSCDTKNPAQLWNRPPG